MPWVVPMIAKSLRHMVLMESVSHQFDEYKNDGTIYGIGLTLIR